MVYGIAFCPVKKNGDLKALGVDDSKALTEVQREGLLQKLFDNNDYIGWAINILSPRHISTSMYRRNKYNLNEISHDTAIFLIR
jgi:ribonuclease H2 subunit A